MKDKGKYKLEIFHEEYPIDPMTFDNLGTIITSYRRYALGNEQFSREQVNSYSNFEDLFKGFLKDNYYVEGNIENWTEKNIFYFPIYLYDHSSLTLSIRPSSCRFDSGQIGFIYVDKTKVYDYYNVKRISRSLMTKVYDLLEAEVKIYSQYLEGNVYSFKLYNPQGEKVNSARSFYGSDFRTNGFTNFLSKEFITQYKKNNIILKVEGEECDITEYPGLL